MKTAYRIVFWLLCVVGLGLRILGAWWYRHDPNPDYAIIVEMVHDMLHGGAWPTFFYGQAYMGSLEPTVSAIIAEVVPDLPFATCLGTALFGFWLLVEAGRWASRVGGPIAGIVTLLLLLVGPTGYFQYMASPRGGYAVALLMIVLLFQKAADLAPPYDDDDPLGFAVLGAYAGLAFWNFWLVLPAIAAVCIFLLVMRGKALFRVVHSVPAVFGFALGSAPFWRWNAAHHWASFGAVGEGNAGGALHAWWALFSQRLPRLLDPGLTSGHFLSVVLSLVLLAILAWVTYEVLRRRDSLALAAVLSPNATPGAPAPHRVLVLWLIFAAIFGLVYGISSFGQTDTPRYLLPIVPAYAVILGVATGALFRARQHLRASLVVGVVVLLCIVQIAGITRISQRVTANEANLEAVRERMETLESLGVDAVLGDYRFLGHYWMGDYRLPVSCPDFERRPMIGARAERAQSIAILGNYGGVDHFLAATGGSATYERITGTRIHRDFHAPTGAVTTGSKHDILSIVDAEGHDLTKPLQSPLLTGIPTTETLEIRFRQPLEVCGVRLLLPLGGTYDTLAIDALPDASKEEGRGPAEITPPYVESGFFWSGPRPYWRGNFHRAETRFPTQRLAGLRLRFTGGGTAIHTIQILKPDPDAQPIDLDAIVAKLYEFGPRTKAGQTPSGVPILPIRVVADRWLSRALAKRVLAQYDFDPILYGKTPALMCFSPTPQTILVAESHALHATRAGLNAFGVEYTETPIGGVTLFTFSQTRRSLDEGPLPVFNGCGVFLTSYPYLKP